MIKEIVIEVGAEGGSLTLFRGKHELDQDWRFFLGRNECAMAGLLSDEDLKGLSLSNNSDFVHTWDEALKLMDKYPWHRLHPVYARNDCAVLIWAALQARTNDKTVLQRWRDVLHNR